MKYLNLGKSDLKVSSVSLGCMRMSGIDKEKATELFNTSIKLGINFFDHADIYGGGKCEEIFGDILKNSSTKREDIIIQSKCGIVPGKMFDFSKGHILNSVDGILKRLQTDYIDVLLLHRPDALAEPSEISEAFDKLHSSGKVRHFGVSNQTPMQIELLKKYLNKEILANQLQLAITHAGMISCNTEMNMLTDGAISRDGYVLDYCRLHDITVQAWSPFQYGFFEGVFLDNDKFKKLNGVLDKLAKKYNVTNMAIATAWILRHPSSMQVIVGTMTKSRLEAICECSQFSLTREEWYEIYISSGYLLP